ncbi:MAG TPA: DNA polymerase III subunit gamma/tau, partial [Terriglobales bacterium]|nr:DNA polymerase III subunit gamma/tau [Terriglobales bacterium]
MYQALYRKWRPATFAEMSGQEAVRTVLSREVASGRLSHAYLFCGTRGTGKTTAAKILAKAANCLAPQDGNPCNKCEMCRGIDDGSVLDVVEIDAASNNGVENVREIREQAQFAPVRAKYRVYIIDEVHMLSAGAYNALLKTLEEPPEHVIFILATTERHKIPATIMSRCQCFDFTRIATPDIAARLMTVAQAEGIDLAPAAADLIARLADGALRNALSILDQCAIAGGAVSVETVETVAGLANRDYLFGITEALAKKDVGALMQAVSGAALQSKDLVVIVGELMTHIRDLLLIQTVPAPDEFLKSPPQEFSALKELAPAFDAEFLLRALKALQTTAFEISRSPVRQTLLEAVLLELCHGETAPPPPENAQKAPAPAATKAPAQKAAESPPPQPESAPPKDEAGKAVKTTPAVR